MALKKELISAMAKKIDSLFDWTKIIPNKIIGSITELADGYILGYGLDYLNNRFGDKIPSQYTDEIEQAIQCFVDGDYMGVLNAIPEGFDQAIDIKFLQDDFEAVFIATNFNAAVQAVIYYSGQKALTAAE